MTFKFKNNVKSISFNLLKIIIYPLLIILILNIHPASSADQNHIDRSSEGVSTWLRGKSVFSLEKDTKLPLCQILQQELIKQQPYPHLMCPASVPLPKDNPDFSIPSWDIIDPIKNNDLAIELYLETLDWRRHGRYGESYPEITSDNLRNEEPRISRGTFPDHLRNYRFLDLLSTNQIRIEHTRLDINFDGKSEDIYRLSAGQCMTSEGQEDLFYTLHVIDPNQDRLEKDVSHRSNQAFNLFFYKGRIYLISDTGPIIVYETFASGSTGTYNLRPVCVFDDHTPAK
jgi:hypothetical protein